VEIAVALSGACCVVTGVLFVAFLLSIPFARRLLAAPSVLGEQLGLTLLVPRQGLRRGDWFGGTRQGRPFALTFVTQKVRSTASETGRGQPTLRIAMPVDRPGGGAIDVRRHVIDQRPFTSFDEAYRKQQGIEALREPEREALLAFARDHGALRVKDRAGHPSQTLPGELGWHSTWVLVHDHFGLDPDPDEVWARIDALVALAELLEGRG